jgi:DNA-binding MarR family transcriptional regulator
MSEEPDESEDLLSEEENAILMEVVNAGDKGITSDDIAKKLDIPVDKVEEILNKFEEDGWFFSEEAEE